MLAVPPNDLSHNDFPFESNLTTQQSAPPCLVEVFVADVREVEDPLTLKPPSTVCRTSDNCSAPVPPRTLSHAWFCNASNLITQKSPPVPPWKRAEPELPNVDLVPPRI